MNTNSLISIPLFVLVAFALITQAACDGASGPEANRPFIWTSQDERAGLLEKIETEAWAASLYEQLKVRADATVTEYENDRDGFLRGLPLEWFEGEDRAPRFYYILQDGGDSPGQVHRVALMKYLQEGVDCGVMYYITGDEKYVRSAADVLATVVTALGQMERGPDSFNGGLVYPNDHLKEARIFGAQIPLVYDFVYPYIAEGAQVYDIVSGEEVPFPFSTAQSVFRTYVDMALESGIVDCNWPVLEASSLLHNILALDDPAAREELLPFVTEVETPHQDSIKKVASSYESPGDMWPESLGYSKHVSQYTVYLMTVLDRIDPSLSLGSKHANVAASLAGIYHLQFPNGEAPAFGDGHRRYGLPYHSFEHAYVLASLNGNLEQIERFGSLIKTGIASGNYKRGRLAKRSFSASPYQTPLQLLWQSAVLEGSPTQYPQHRTEVLPFAGIHLQRNVPETNPVENALMAWVGAGHFVHGHASGMNIELYGKGVVLGVTNGKGTYRTDIHENYYRLFAAHNTVVSNGASASKGGWVSLGINQLELQAMEPMPRANAVSKDHSFSTTRFYDEHNLVAPAWHERTLAVVRTSEKTGYYVDVFRAKSDYEGQFHDYIYRNIGERLSYAGVELGADDGRFAGSAKLPWIGNQQFRHPGWHFFRDVSVSKETDQPVQALFTAEQAGSKGLGMAVFMNGEEGRSYASVMSPPATLNSVKYYETMDTPTMVVRKQGDAWAQPFAAIYEPFEMEARNRSVKSVEALEEDGVFKGFRVASEVDGGELEQLILIQERGQRFEIRDLSLSFEGHFAIVSRVRGELVSIYIGDGRRLSVGETELTVVPGETSAYREFR